ncbi:MAG: DUF2500 domain-containing protein [Clostridia bacterium]|nr:DUF2500 domain-containing protein [Clostridia bacterium]
MEIFIGIFFVVWLVMFVGIISRNIAEWGKNNASPRLSVDARVVTKRSSMHVHHHGNHNSHSHSYYVTFEVQSGDRMELRMTGREYGMLAEGDFGVLSFQGTRYLGFERSRPTDFPSAQ